MKTNQKGISLIEVILAVGLLIVVVSALIRLGVTTLDTSDAARIRAIAQQLADESLDIARYVRDNDPSGFSNLAGDYEIFNNNSFITTNCDPSIPDVDENCDVVVSKAVNQDDITFYRVVRFIDLDDPPLKNQFEVVAYVFWDNKATYSSVITSTYLTRWRN